MKYNELTKEQKSVVDMAIGYELQSIGSLLTGTTTSEDYGPNPYYNTIMAMPNGSALWQVVDDFVTTDETKEINKALEEAKKEEEEKKTMINIFEAREAIDKMEKEINQRKIEEAEKIYKKVYNHPRAMNDAHNDFLKEIQNDLEHLILVLKEYR